VAASSCASALAGDAPGGAAPAAAAVRRESVSGPIRATVTLSPERPALGDPLALTLEVEAEPGVEVRMPAFGEALGRFEIVDFAPRERRTEAGGTRAEQRYTLDAPMSGRHTIPPLAVEFVDRRAAAPGKRPEPQELLTEPITLEVASALGGGAVTATAAMRPPRGRLDEAWPPPTPVERAAGPVALALVAAAVGGALLVRRLRRGPTPISAFEAARAALASLESAGVPSGEALDAWTVRLSAIVRRYVEDRYGLRAPERTTEEFMREASRSPAIRPEHRTLLRAFLEHCDRVKFAAYRPAEAESRGALASARRFVEETRPAAGGEGGGA
jgi:hypothetical protein